MESNQKDTGSHFIVVRQKGRKAVTLFLLVVAPGSRPRREHRALQGQSVDTGSRAQPWLPPGPSFPRLPTPVPPAVPQQWLLSGVTRGSHRLPFLLAVLSALS